jgi:hypothetical protein
MVATVNRMMAAEPMLAIFAGIPAERVQIERDRKRNPEEPITRDVRLAGTSDPLRPGARPTRETLRRPSGHPRVGGEGSSQCLTMVRTSGRPPSTSWASVEVLRAR